MPSILGSTEPVSKSRRSKKRYSVPSVVPGSRFTLGSPKDSTSPADQASRPGAPLTDTSLLVDRYITICSGWMAMLDVSTAEL